MKKKLINVREYIEPLVKESLSDAIEAAILTVMILVLLAMIGKNKGMITEALMVLRVFATVFFSSIGIRNAKNVDYLIIEFAVYVVSVLYCITSIALLVVSFIF